MTCHYGEAGGPWPLVEYAHVASWLGEVRAELLSCAMPPPGAAPLSEAEMALLLSWIRCGGPR